MTFQQALAIAIDSLEGTHHHLLELSRDPFLPADQLQVQADRALLAQQTLRTVLDKYEALPPRV